MSFYLFQPFALREKKRYGFEKKSTRVLLIWLWWMLHITYLASLQYEFLSTIYIKLVQQFDFFFFEKKNTLCFAVCFMYIGYSKNKLLFWRSLIYLSKQILRLWHIHEVALLHFNEMCRVFYINTFHTENITCWYFLQHTCWQLCILWDLFKSHFILELVQQTTYFLRHFLGFLYFTGYYNSWSSNFCKHVHFLHVISLTYVSVVQLNYVQATWKIVPHEKKKD